MRAEEDRETGATRAAARRGGEAERSDAGSGRGEAERRDEETAARTRREAEQPVGRAFGAGLFGVDALVVEVEAARARGEPRAAIVGQAEGAVREARERMRIALQRAALWNAEDSELAALVINDHFAKFHAPGWCTGKLSDAAILVVGPLAVRAVLAQTIP